MEAARSYDLDAIDRERELARLELQATVADELERARLARLRLPRDATVLDVGCGPGFATRRLATLVPLGRAIGVDADPDLVARARARNSRPNVRYLVGHAEQLPVQDAYADLVHARFLLQHVPDPLAALREFRRVLRPGGRALVVDSDDLGLAVHPPVAGLDRLVAAAARAQARRGGDRTIGRRLRGLMLAAGMESVRVEVVPVTSEMVGFSTFVHLALGWKAQVIDPDDLPPHEVDAVLRRLLDLARRPDAFAVTLVFVAEGRRPAREGGSR